MQTEVVHLLCSWTAAHPVEDGFVGHQRSVALPAGDQQEVGVGEVGERGVDLEAERSGVRAHGPRLDADEAHLGARDA